MRNYEHWHKFRNNKARLKQLKQRKSDLALLRKFIKLINFLSIKNPNYNFVIRPHPSENINDWKDAPTWTKSKIKIATKDWFKVMSKNQIKNFNLYEK